MARVLPRLRMDLDFMPSPAPEHPGLLIRDPFQFSDATLIVPPPLIECLECFDGEQTELELRQLLTQITGDLETSELLKHLRTMLSRAGFLEDEVFARQREERIREFAEAEVREPAHAGSAYPHEPDDLRELWNEYTSPVEQPAADRIVGIAAPHVSPSGGWQSYQAAYQAARQIPNPSDRIFVVLGTSHYGAGDHFGLTRKRFVTPFGATRNATHLVDELASQAPGAVKMEDYCHAVEHSIEFQVVYLQHLFGPDITVLPILCGAFAHSLLHGGKPEDNDEVRRFFGALGNIAAREGDRLFWVLGVDMAHIGRRYGDSESAIAGEGMMQEVETRDRQRMSRINEADPRGFWDLVQQSRDDLKWCGSSPFYTFLNVMPNLRGELLRYEQWNIDPLSVVSFAGMQFSPR